MPQKIDADVRAKYGNTQEPELTVLKGVGPFAVALYQGANTLGEFSAPDKPEVNASLREIDEVRSKRLLGQILQSGQFAGATITTNQTGGINLGASNTFGTFGDIVAGDKIISGATAPRSRRLQDAVGESPVGALFPKRPYTTTRRPSEFGREPFG